MDLNQFRHRIAVVVGILAVAMFTTTSMAEAKRPSGDGGPVAQAACVGPTALVCGRVAGEVIRKAAPKALRALKGAGKTKARARGAIKRSAATAKRMRQGTPAQAYRLFMSLPTNTLGCARLVVETYLGGSHSTAALAIACLKGYLKAKHGGWNPRRDPS